MVRRKLNVDHFLHSQNHQQHYNWYNSIYSVILAILKFCNRGEKNTPTKRKGERTFVGVKLQKRKEIYPWSPSLGRLRICSCYIVYQRTMAKCSGKRRLAPFTFSRINSENDINARRNNLLTVRASHRESVLSAEHVNSVFEYGRNTILFTESAWPRRVCRQRSL